MDEFKLIVAGGRDFNNSDLMADVLSELASGIYDQMALSIVSGMARGADRMAYDFAKAEGVVTYEFPADWDRYGKRAGFVRNEAMGDFADGLLAFWDGQSRGTKHMIDYMLLTLKKRVHVVRYDNPNPYIRTFN